MGHRRYRVQKENGDNSKMRHTGAGHSSDIGPSAICTTGQGKAQGKLCVSGHCFSCAIFFGLSHSDIGTTAICTTGAGQRKAQRWVGVRIVSLVQFSVASFGYMSNSFQF